jgi:hypothetical protein
MSPLAEKRPSLLPSSGTERSIESSARSRLPQLAGWVLSAFAILLLISTQGTSHCSHHAASLPHSFVEHCTWLLEPPPGTYTDRIIRLTNALEPNTIWIAEPGTSSEYFLGGFSSRDWWLSERPLLIAISPSQKNITILTAKFEQARAELVNIPREIQDTTTFVPWLESESPYDILSRHFGADAPKRVVLDGQVRSFIGEGLEGAGFGKSSQDEAEKVKGLRERKDDREIGLLRCANQVRPFE